MARSRSMRCARQRSLSVISAPILQKSAKRAPFSETDFGTSRKYGKAFFRSSAISGSELFTNGIGVLRDQEHHASLGTPKARCDANDCWNDVRSPAHKALGPAA